MCFGVCICYCPYVESSLVLLEEGVCYDQCFPLAELYQPLPCFILYSKAKFACFYRCFLTSYFCIPVPYHLGVSSRRSYRSSQNHSTSASSALLVGAIDLDYRDIELFALEMNRDHSVIFEIASKYCISDSFVDHDGYSISSEGVLPAVVDIMVI